MNIIDQERNIQLIYIQLIYLLIIIRYFSIEQKYINPKHNKGI